MKKRYVTVLVLFMFLFSSVIGRCLYIALDKTYYISESYNSYEIEIGTLYTNIYDRKGIPLNNYKSVKVAVIEPDEKCLSELELLFSSEKAKEIKKTLEKGYPVSAQVEKEAETKFIKQYEKIIENPSDMPAKHLLSKEYGGLEYFESEELGSFSVNYSINARGELLSGDSIFENNNNYYSKDGIIISIDNGIQHIAEKASSSISKGAVVVLDVSTSQLLASVSKGDDYINRAISPYAIGSIFKLVVCACALENGVSMSYKCDGSIKVSDTTFHCQNSKVHGIQNMKQALANSCNCYFIQLANELGANKLYSTAQKLGFGKEISLYNDFKISEPPIAKLSDLSSLGELSLFAFGQGKLTDTPVHFASVVAMIANGGLYNYPTLDIIEGDNIRVLSEENSKTLREYMRYVVTDGTGRNADYKGKSAGKTSTAQSGTFVNGKELLNTFFAGFYPYDNPKYAIVVMCENGNSGAEDCCPVFRTMVEMLDKM